MCTLFTRITSLTLLAIALLGCRSTAPDSQQFHHDGGKTVGRPPAYEDLKQRDDVLINLELAYNEKNSPRVEQLLNEDFVFFFGAQDISEGNVGVTQWDRADEITATENLFNHLLVTGIRHASATDEPRTPVESATWGRIKWIFSVPEDSMTTISLSLVYPPGEDTWNELNGPPPETWYEKTVAYLLQVDVAGTTYLNTNPLQASIVVREAEVHGNDIWQIVQWRDDVGN